MIIAGFLYATSVGDSHKIELAKSAMTSAIIGIAIIFYRLAGYRSDLARNGIR